MFKLTPTEDVQHFLSLIESGQKPSAAAKKSGLNPHEAILVRRLAGLPVNGFQRQIPEQVVNLRSQGKTYRQIAEQLNISQSYVNLCLVRHRKQSR